jgi:hypothetical protein
MISPDNTKKRIGLLLQACFVTFEYTKHSKHV